MTPVSHKAIAGKAAVIFDDDEQAALVALDAETMQAVGGELHLLVPAQLGIAGGVHADAVAAERGGGIEPLEMVLDGLGALGLIGIAEIALAVAHDEQPFTPSPSWRFFISAR
jgi:hypothetical protein